MISKISLRSVHLGMREGEREKVRGFSLFLSFLLFLYLISLIAYERVRDTRNVSCVYQLVIFPSIDECYINHITCLLIAITIRGDFSDSML